MNNISSSNPIAALSISSVAPSTSQSSTAVTADAHAVAQSIILPGVSSSEMIIIPVPSQVPASSHPKKERSTSPLYHAIPIKPREDREIPHGIGKISWPDNDNKHYEGQFRDKN